MSVVSSIESAKPRRRERRDYHMAEKCDEKGRYFAAPSRDVTVWMVSDNFNEAQGLVFKYTVNGMPRVNHSTGDIVVNLCGEDWGRDRLVTLSKDAIYGTRLAALNAAQEMAINLCAAIAAEVGLEKKSLIEESEE